MNTYCQPTNTHKVCGGGNVNSLCGNYIAIDCYPFFKCKIEPCDCGYKGELIVDQVGLEGRSNLVNATICPRCGVLRTGIKKYA